MALIYYKSNFQIFNFIIFWRSFLKSLAYKNLHLLNRCNNHLSVIRPEFFLKIIYIICLINIYKVIICIRLKCHCSLRIQIFSINQENRFINCRNIHQKISCCFIGSQCLSRTGCVPYITGFSRLRCLSDRLNCMNLIWAKQNQTFCILIQHCISRNHFMRFRNPKNTFCKIKIICHLIIVFIHPATHKLRI